MYVYARGERIRACPSRRDAPLNLCVFTLPNDVSRTTFLPSAFCQLSPALALRFRVVFVAVHEMASALARTILARRFHVSASRHALSKFAMPAMSPTMTEGGIASWKKKEGESFAAGDVLLEIETDKATIDVEAQDDGILAKIIAQDGAKNIAVGSPIAIIGEEGDDPSGAEQLAAEAASEKPKASEEKAPEAPKSEPAPEKKEQKAETSKQETKSELPTGDRIYASPIAKKIALERGIPLAKVKGSGPNGRILREDVEKYQAPAAAASATPSTAVPSPSAPLPEYTDTPVSNMRRTIGSRLTQSKQELPHYYLTVDINMDKVLKLREVFNKSLAEKDKSAKLSVNDFVLKAVGCALADVPEANSAWLGEVIRQYKKADISVAVATPTGLITPIIKDVGSKGLASISAEGKALAKKARDGKLQPQEYQGGTFTVSNLGMFGISHFTAIINPPQSCILAVGATQATLVPAPEEERGFKVAQVMKVTLSADHRTVDGAVGARWLQAFKGYLENPLTFML
ncbi:dihydrolipoamide acetyltransferase, partial [Cubamyces sp. BRFM 1775]